MKQYTKIAIPIYSKEQYSKLLSMADDANTMEQSWEEWKEKKDRYVKSIQNKGMEIEEVPLDVWNLKKYCEENHLPNKEATRAKYASEKIRNI